MADDVWVFDQQSMRKLRADHNRLEQQVENMRRLLKPEVRPTQTPGIPFLLGKVYDATIAAGSHGLVDIWTVQSGSEAKATWQTQAYDWAGSGAIKGDKVELFRHAQSGRLYFVLACQSRIAKTTGSFPIGTGTVRLYTGTTGSETDSGVDFSCYNRFGTIATTKWVAVTFTGAGWEAIATGC